MKIRQGFVSNSSSSSFIVMETEPLVNFLLQGEVPMKDEFRGQDLVFDSYNCNTQFGWETREYTSFWDKAMWAYLQAGYSNSEIIDDRKNMLVEVIKEHTGANSVTFDVDTENYNAYIDHQSTVAAEPTNGIMFESAGLMKAFLFSPMSYIKNGNDNG